MADLRTLFTHFQHFVDLLLVFHYAKAHFRVVDRETHIPLPQHLGRAAQESRPRPAQPTWRRTNEGRFAPTTTTCSPRCKPAWWRPQAICVTICNMAAQSMLCQMPYSFSRMALAHEGAVQHGSLTIAGTWSTSEIQVSCSKSVHHARLAFDAMLSFQRQFSVTPTREFPI